jgi:hypothetical protein
MDYLPTLLDSPVDSPAEEYSGLPPRTEPLVATARPPTARDELIVARSVAIAVLILGASAIGITAKKALKRK